MGKVKLKKKIHLIQVGSTIQQNYGENLKKHGYGIYDLETDEYSFVNLHNPKPFVAFRINSYEDIENGTERLVNH